MASVGVIWGPATLRLLRHAASKASKAVRTQLAGATRPLQGEAGQVRSGFTGRQPIHPAALLKQQRRSARWFSSATAQNVNAAVRRFMSSESAGAPRFDRSRLPASNTSRRVAQFSGRAPFANALRPNLTGGALPRSAGGYSLGGGARYFSHSPAAPAQVVQNVSQAMRAFFLSGQKLRYDGVGPRGQKQYRAVSSLEDETMSKIGAFAPSAPGAFIDFHLSPTVTALSPLAAAISGASVASGFKAEAAAASLNTEGLLDVLSADFGRALKDLTAIFADLRRLAVLGDLPISMEQKDTLRVRFPGMDASTIERLCDDVGIERGLVGEDPDFEATAGVPMALQFPFAPGSDATITSPGGSARSLGSHEFDAESSLEDDSFLREAFVDAGEVNPWLSEAEGYESVSPLPSSMDRCSDSFEGLEGVYRFLEECDRAQGRLG
ncbi:casein kinase II beta 2 subunit [Sarocladium implicatum]|nr:casein kinase II beta 2 subunit [Sarocladium implicatum]